MYKIHAYEKKVIKSSGGLYYYPIATVKEALNYKDVEGLIIPGGYNDEQRQELTELIVKLNKEEKLLCAICAGPQYLARAGVLKGINYTTSLTETQFKKYFPKAKDPFSRDTYVNKNVVRDKNIITAVGNAFVDFSIEVGDYFHTFKDEKEKSECANHYKGLI